MGQLTFDGHEIVGFRLDTPVGEKDLGEIPLPQGFETYVPSNGDEWEIRLRVRVGPAIIGSSYDKKSNLAKDGYGRRHKLEVVEEGFAVTQIVLEADKAALWAVDHGATG